MPAYPFNFDQPDKLVESLRGVDVLYNTYWVRFNHPTFTHADAVQNTLTLFEAAQRAGVRRIVHVSITNPSEDSRLEYFRGKARLERALRESGLSYAILRPTVLFGKEDILINNIAWAIRHLPVMGVFGDGQYRVQPIHVDDLAALAVAQGQQADLPDTIISAIRPETQQQGDRTGERAQVAGRVPGSAVRGRGGANCCPKRSSVNDGALSIKRSAATNFAGVPQVVSGRLGHTWLHLSMSLEVNDSSALYPP